MPKLTSTVIDELRPLFEGRLTKQSKVVRQNTLLVDLLEGAILVPCGEDVRTLQSYFSQWGAELPQGSGWDESKLFAGDVAQAAAIGYMGGFVAHCHKGPLKCKSKPVFERRETLKKGCKTKQAVNLVKTQSPSCEKAHGEAMKRAKGQAMREAEKRYTPALFEAGHPQPTDSHLINAPSVEIMVDSLRADYQNPIDYAHDMGIRSPWADVTLEQLHEALGMDAKEYVDKGFASERITDVWGGLNPRTVDILSMRADGRTWDEIGREVGITPNSAQVAVSRLRQTL